MADRFKFAEVRQEVIEMLKKDLLGPSSENEILNQNPRFEYIVGMLAPQTSENDSNEQEIDGDASFEGDADYTAGEDDDNEPVFTNRFKTPSSIGISFYLESSTKSFNVDVTWGDYTKASDKTTNKEGKEVDVSTYKRHPQKETVVIDLQEFSKNKEYPLVCDSNVILYVSKIGLKQGYTLITAYVNNKRKNPESDIAGMMFQVNLRAYSQDKMDIFVAEHICRKILAVDEFYFAQRPILGRGRGCAATWKANKNGRASEIVSTFIPEYEFPGVSAALEGFDPFFFSMRTLSVAKKKDDIINRLNVLANSYEDWIQKKLIHDSKMDDAKFKKEIGDTVINKCIEALGRIRAGIQLLVEDDTAFDAFCFMNRSMILQRNIMNFSKKHGAGIECAFRDFVDPRDPSNNFGWRPFQIAFILMNLKGIVDPEHEGDEQMTKEEIQASIKSIMFSGSVCGIEIYACLRDESGYQTKKIRATDKLLSSTKDKVAGFINCTYLADDAEFDTSENIADNKKEFYEISLIENYRPFIFLDDAEKRTEYYSESDRNKLSGFLFRINLNDKYFWVYQHIYSVSRIDRSKNVIALFVGDTYDEIDSDIVQIDSRADVIIFSSSVVTAKMDLMQRFFGFEQYIRAGAQKTIEIIRDLDIVDSLEKFVAFENKSKLTNAKKLLKAKNSPVLQMKKNDLLENLKKHSRYKTMFKFEEDHIVISSQKEAAAFIKMLNDDIVRSELTGKEYDSSSKMLLGPVGASH